MATIGYGVIGLGFFGEKHLQVATSLPNIEVLAVCTRRDQRRKDPEASPYINHPIALARVLSVEAGLHDTRLLAAAVLHDTLEDTDVMLEELRSEFGESVAALVDGVSKLTNMPLNVDGHSRKHERELEYIRKMLLAMGHDVRVVLVKLADRLHNMRTLGYMPPHKQQQIARETLDIFAPLANRAPSGEKSTDCTQSVCARCSRTSERSATFHNRTVRAAPALNRCSPDGENATASTATTSATNSSSR